MDVKEKHSSLGPVSGNGLRLKRVLGFLQYSVHLG